MFTEMVCSYLPSEWTYRQLWSYSNEDYKLVDLPMHTTQYSSLKARVNGSFNLGVSKIQRVENPYLYGQFLLKRAEYETRGSVNTSELYHDTAELKISSIVSSNLDWRMANRVKYGRGVSFSPSPAYANQESSRNNGSERAMIIADVLIQKQQSVNSTLTLPGVGYDTTVGNMNKVYVKYYDNEFYPKYVVYYESRPHVYRRNNRFLF